MSYFTHQIEARLKELGISKFRLSVYLDMPQGQLANVLSGKRPKSDAFLERLANVPEFGISLQLLQAWRLVDEADPHSLLRAVQLCVENETLHRSDISEAFGFKK
jgi:transcriptional regulator with XRE-family HTH domain